MQSEINHDALLFVYCYCCFCTLWANEWNNEWYLKRFQSYGGW